YSTHYSALCSVLCIIPLYPTSTPPHSFLFFFFNDPPTTETYTLSLHDALPISRPLGVAHRLSHQARDPSFFPLPRSPAVPEYREDRKSTRLNSSHRTISYAVFCLKKKKNNSPT